MKFELVSKKVANLKENENYYFSIKVTPEQGEKDVVERTLNYYYLAGYGYLFQIFNIENVEHKEQEISQPIGLREYMNYHVDLQALISKEYVKFKELSKKRLKIDS